VAGLESRLKKIEGRLNMQSKYPATEPEFIDLLDLPKDTVIGALGILKDATGGFQCMLKQDQIERASSNQFVTLDQLTPDQFYSLMLAQRGSRLGP
jgi:hypothetical protein